MSKPNISKLKKKLLKLVQDHVKERDGYTDQRSGEVVSGSNCHGAHIIPESQGNRLKFDPRNIIVLSYHNHINWWHKNPVEAGEWFTRTFPDTWEYLVSVRQVKVHWKLFDYQAMIMLAETNQWEAYQNYLDK